MKTKAFAIMVLFFLFAAVSYAFADGTNAAGTNILAGNTLTSPMTPTPASTVNPLLAIVTIAVPLIVALIKTKLFPKIPSVYLPLIAVALGLVITYLMTLASLTTINPFWGMLLGAAGTGLREIKDQILPAGPSPLPTPESPNLPLK